MESQLSESYRKTAATKAIVSAAAGLLISTLLLPASATAADVTKVYTWREGQNQPTIPQTIQGNDGQEMRITSQTQPTQTAPNQTTTQFFQESWIGECSADQLRNAATLVPATIHIDSNGFVGDIPRTGNINYTPINITVTETLEQTRTGATIDPQMVPQSITHEGRVYTLYDAPTLTPSKTDSSGTPIMWNYTATYIYENSSEVFDHYELSAQYAGNLTKTTTAAEWSISAVYHSDDPPAVVPDINVAEPVQENQPEVNPTEEAQTTSSENTEALTTGAVADSSNTLSTDSGMSRIGDTNNNSSENNSEATTSSSEEANKPEEKIGVQLPFIAGICAGSIALAGLLTWLIKKKKKTKLDAASEVAAAAAVDEEPVCQLFAVKQTDDGYQQTPMANLSMDVSGDPAIPSVARFPEMVDETGNQIEFVPSNDEDYWIAVDETTVENAASDQIIVATADGHEVYRGNISQQLQLDTETLTNSLNNAADSDDVRDISDELNEYAKFTDVAPAAAASTAAAAAAYSSEEETEDMDSDVDETTENYLDDYVSDEQNTDYADEEYNLETDNESEDFGDVELVDEDFEDQDNDFGDDLYVDDENNVNNVENTGESVFEDDDFDSVDDLDVDEIGVDDFDSVDDIDVDKISSDDFDAKFDSGEDMYDLYNSDSIETDFKTLLNDIR